MGFYFRRSVTFGPLRFNFSKSGIGVSAGVKGARISTGPRGTYIHMGRHGFYYRQRLDGPRPQSGGQEEPRSRPFTATPPPSGAGTVETAGVDDLVDTTSEKVLAQINEHARLWRLAPWAALIGVVGALLVASADSQAAWAVVAMAVPLTALAHQRDLVRRTAPLFYELEDEALHRFQALQQACEGLSQAHRVWRVESQQPNWDWKRNAGASSLISRRAGRVGRVEPPCIKTNVAIWGVDLGSTKLLFFPDRLLVFAGTYGAVPYDSLGVEASPTRFIEDEGVPRDADVVGSTWQYVRKDGGPDRRFANNRQIPIALYGLLRLTSPTGMNILLHVSSRERAAAFADAINRLFRPARTGTSQGSAREQSHTSAGGHSDGAREEHPRQDHARRARTEAKPPVSDAPRAPHDVLGVKPGATNDEISAAYRRMAQMYHPDKVASLAPEFRELAERRMREINAAYEALKS